ncbi:MAG: GNAT family N-acetyltransferase [Myxococcota bacterium]|nr:GNAT family N-acetyltransferase [Myxococcota bacterium]
MTKENQEAGELRVELADGVSLLDRSEWNALVGDESPFLEWEWLASLEEAGCVGARTGWDPRPLVVREGERLVAACPLYVKSHSEGEFVFDWGWADAAERSGIRYYPKLLVGVPFTPVGGQRLLTASDADASRYGPVLAGALREICRDNELSSVHVNFCREDEADLLEQEGYLKRVGIQYHWHNEGYATFEDYLDRFRSKRRNQVRRERREVARQDVRVEALAGDEIGDELFEPMYRFYLSTIHDRAWGRQYLNPDFFELLRERFRSRLVFVVALRSGVPIAGAFNVAKGETLYGRYWGSDEHVRNLHFEVCYYAGIEHCIERGLSRFEPGAGGEYKQLRGFDARPTWSSHFVLDPRLRAAIDRFLEAERHEAAEAIDLLQERSALKS